MKSIARLIVAIPTLIVATQTSVLGQQFPSTTHGGFDGSVVEIPEATLSLPKLGGEATNITLGVPSGIDQVGGYQSVMGSGTQVVLPATSSRTVAASSSRTVATPSVQSAPIITVDPANVNQPSTSGSTPLQLHQNAIVDQGTVQIIDSGQAYRVGDGSQAYLPSGEEVFFEDGGQDFFIEDSQISQESVLPREPEQRVVRQSRRTPGARSGGRVFSTAGASALLLNRNYGTNRNFATNGTDILSSGNTEFDVLPGVDAFVSRRRMNGLGWEARYFGLYPADTSTQVDGASTHLLPGLDQLSTSYASNLINSNTVTIGQTAGAFFNLGDPQVLTRQTELHNIEFNLLRNAIPRLRATQTEFLLGFRYLNFGETLLHESIGLSGGSTLFTTPESVGYFSTAENEMLGLQVGVRSDYQLGSRLMLHLGLKAGAFNNTVNTRQRVDYRMPDGSVLNPSIGTGDLTGTRFDIGAEDEVKSLLGEVDIAASLQLSSAARVRVGYRALGITDVAFASDQIPDDFSDASTLLNPTSDGTLILQGTYVGLEFAY